MSEENVGRWRGIAVGGRGRVAGLPRNERATAPGVTGYVPPSPHGASAGKKAKPAKRSSKGTTKGDRIARDQRIRAEAAQARAAFEAKRWQDATNLTREGLLNVITVKGPTVLVSVPAGVLLGLLDELEAHRSADRTTQET